MWKKAAHRVICGKSYNYFEWWIWDFCDTWSLKSRHITSPYILLASHFHTERKPRAPLGCQGLCPSPSFCLAFSAPDAYVSIILPRPQACLLLARKGGTSLFAPCDEDSPLRLCGVPSLTFFPSASPAFPSLLCFADPYGVLP